MGRASAYSFQRIAVEETERILMAIKFEKLEVGMRLFDIHKQRMGNTTMSEWGCWNVEILSIDRIRRTAMVCWNSNAADEWSAARLSKLFAKKPPSYLKAEAKQSKRWGG
jgi:hypothetical protein